MNTDALSMGNAVTMRAGGRGPSLGHIDQYEILRELGGGGFGSVYLARNTVSGIEVAVKGLPPTVRSNREELENIRQNFALVSTLHHPNIAAAFDLHPAKDVVYADETTRQNLRVLAGDTLMVMEFAPGVTLSSWRKQFPEGRVPLPQALAITRQIAAALDYSHERKIVHRDVKPANVMVETLPDDTVRVRVLDFGLAAEIRTSLGRVSREIHDTSGTRPYMAPEQWLGERQGPWSDQYSLAVLFHELIFGDVPFGSVFQTGDPVVMMNVVGRQPVSFSKGVSRVIRQALVKALSKDGAARFDSCQRFVDALEGKVRVKASRRFVPIATVSVLLAMCFAGGTWYAIDRQQRQEQRLADEKRQREAEEKRLAEEKRQREAEEKRLAEEKRQREAEEKRLAEEKRQREAEEKRLAEEKCQREAEVKRPADEARQQKGDDLDQLLDLERSKPVAANVAPKVEPKPEPKVEPKPEPKVEPKPEPKVEPKPEPKVEPKPAPKPVSLTVAELKAIDTSALSAGAERTVDIGGGVLLKLLWCPPGSYTMGSPEIEYGRDRFEVQTSQTIARGFWLGKYEVTQAQWKQVMHYNPSFYAVLNPESCPVESVNLEECQRFVSELNGQLGTRGFRLPTSVEWEYACRAGTTGAYAVEGEAFNHVRTGPRRTTPVGTYPANPWGFCDMHGNVGEWTPDVLEGRFFQRNGVAVRGGCWKFKPVDCRSASMRRENAREKTRFYGLRIAFDPSAE